MTKQLVARVVIESVLPQLSGEYDYLVPEAMQDDIEVGCRVAVQIGRSKKVVTGFVTELLPESTYASRELIQVLGPAMLTTELLQTCRISARRQVVALGEFLRAAVPAFMPTQEIPDGYERLPGSLSLQALAWQPPSGFEVGNLAFLASPRPARVAGDLVFDWTTLFLSVAIQHLNRGESSLVIVPEESDFQPLQQAARLHGVSSALITLQDKRRSARYRHFWQARKGSARVFLGTRSALLHPAHKLGAICIFDDLDDSLRPKGSPYIHARELALIRGQVSGARVVIAAPYRSLEVQRLVKIGFAKELSSLARPPKISHYDSGDRLPPEFFSLIRSALQNGPALVLVPSRDWAAALRCQSCHESIRCSKCSGPGYAPTKGRNVCRLCLTTITSCGECGSRSLASGRPGASRTAAELGRAFPGTVVRDFSGESAKTRVAKGDVVVATPSAAPRLAQGYAAVAILDGNSWLSRPFLRAEQFAIRDWQEAISLLSPEGRAALFGVPGAFGQIFAVQDFIPHAAGLLEEVSQLHLPPAWRVCRVAGPPTLVTLAGERATEAGAEVVSHSAAAGPNDSSSLLLRFSYQRGMDVADALHEVALRSSLKGSATGKRVLKIAMDDLEGL